MNLLLSQQYKDELKKSTFFKSSLKSKIFGRTIFITGGTGLICSTVVDLLMELNESYDAKIKIIVGARNYNKFYNRFLEGQKNNNLLEFYQYDSLKDTFDGRADYIIHGASNASPELYSTRPTETIMTNIFGTIDLLKYVRQNKKCRMLFISSSEVYGKKQIDLGYKENDYGVIDLSNLRSSYAESKRVSELLCRASVAESGTDIIIARPGHIFGPAASIADKRVSSEFPRLIAEGKSIQLKSSGSQRRSYCYSIDCASALMFCLLNGEAGESYNIANKDVMSIREMAEWLSVCGKGRLKYDECNEESKKFFNPMDHSILNSDKLHALGYRQAFTAKEGLQHTVEILRYFINKDQIKEDNFEN